MHAIAAAEIRRSVAVAKIVEKPPPDVPVIPRRDASTSGWLARMSSAVRLSVTITPSEVKPTSSGASWPC